MRFANNLEIELARAQL